MKTLRQLMVEMARWNFIKRTAAIWFMLAVVLYIPGCSDFTNDDDNGLGGDTVLGITNPYDGITIGDSYWIGSDTLSHASSAFNTENLAKLTYPMSKSQDVEVITTTNRASRTEDDFSLSVAASAKAKFGIGSGSVSNTYNHSSSKVHAENALTWTSRNTRTGQVFSIDWEEYKYTDFYGCLSKKAQERLATIFDYYGQTLAMIKADKIDTEEGKAVVSQYLSAVNGWYAAYGYGFVSGLWVGMLGRADLTITSIAANATSTYSNSTSVSYSNPFAGGGLNVAVSGLSADYKSKATGNVAVAVMPANTEMMNWKTKWQDQFTGKLGSITDMLKIDPSPSVYTGTKAEPPALELPSAKASASISDKFQVADLDGAKACARVLDWEKNGKTGEAFDAYLARKEEEKKAAAEKFKDKDKGNFDDNVKKIVEPDLGLVQADGALLEQDFSSAQPDGALLKPQEPDLEAGATPWADFMNQWTTLGVYITRWSDVIPPLTLTSDVSGTDGDMTSGLVYLWAVRYHTSLIRLADYIDMCYPYATASAWKTQATNIVSFRNQLREKAKEFESAMNAEMDNARKDSTYTSAKFFDVLTKTKNDQISQMLIPKMYECWSANYDFFKQADFGCGLVMMPGGYMTTDSQFIFAGLNGSNANQYYGPGGLQVNWLRSIRDSRDYLRDPGIFANLPKLLPLISTDGKIMFLMIGTNRQEGVDKYGILDAYMMCLYKDGEVFTVDALTEAKNESRVFIAEGVSLNVYMNFISTWYRFGECRGNYFYQDPGTTESLYLMTYSAMSSGGAALAGVFCSLDTIFYLVPLSGFAEGTKVRGVRISDELPGYVADPFHLYSEETAETLLEDTPSVVYSVGAPSSIEEYMDNVLNTCRVWKGLLPEPE